MSVVIETTLGDITVDLYLDQRPVTCLNFLKLCKMKYYNYNLFHTIRSDFIAQTGDPTGEGTGGESIWGILEGPQKRFFSGEKMPKIRHTGAGLLSMVCTDEMMVGSQFFFTLAPDLDSLDGVHCVIGEVTEGHEVLTKLNEVICDETNRPYRDVRITHTVVLEDPFNDPPGLRAPSRSPSPNPERLKGGRIAPDEEIDETQGKSMEEVQEMIEEKEAKARATILEIVGDLPDADIAPPENVLFVCKLNPVTTDDDLEIIFSRFGKIVSCEVIKDKKTGNSLQYAFIEFENKKSCEDAYFKMDNVLIDDRRIHVDFSQSVSKMRYLGKGRGVQYLNDEVITNPEIKKRGDTSRQSYNERKKYDKEERDDSSRRNHDRRHYENEKGDRSRHTDRRQYEQERNDVSRKQRQNKNEEDNRAKTRHNDRSREDVPRKQYIDRERDDSSKRNNHDQRLDQERSESRKVKNYREESERKSRNIKNERDTRGRYERNRENKNVYKSRSRSRSRNCSSERLTKNGDHKDRRHYELERYERNHKPTNKREMSSSPKRDRNERSPRRQKDTGFQETVKEDKKQCNALEKNHKSSGKEERQKLKNNEHKSKDRHESNKKTKHKDSRTPSPDYKKKEKSTRKDKGKTTSKKTTSKRKHKKSTSSDSDSESSSSSSTSSSSSDSDKKKSKVRRRKRKHSSSSSSDSSPSSSSSSDSSDSSSSSSDSEPRKKRVKKNKNKSSTKKSKK